MPTSALLLTEGIGFVASVVSFVLWWPQAARVWRHRHDGGQLGGVSISSQVLLVVNAALWGAYAVVTGLVLGRRPGPGQRAARAGDDRAAAPGARRTR